MVLHLYRIRFKNPITWAGNELYVLHRFKSPFQADEAARNHENRMSRHKPVVAVIHIIEDRTYNVYSDIPPD